MKATALCSMQTFLTNMNLEQKYHLHQIIIMSNKEDLEADLQVLHMENWRAIKETRMMYFTEALLKPAGIAYLTTVSILSYMNLKGQSVVKGRTAEMGLTDPGQGPRVGRERRCPTDEVDQEVRKSTVHHPSKEDQSKKKRVQIGPRLVIIPGILVLHIVNQENELEMKVREDEEVEVGL